VSGEGEARLTAEAALRGKSSNVLPNQSTTEKKASFKVRSSPKVTPDGGEAREWGRPAFQGVQSAWLNLTGHHAFKCWRKLKLYGEKKKENHRPSVK